MPVDWSLLSERTCYTLLNEAGVPASRVVHVELSINGVIDGSIAFWWRLSGVNHTLLFCQPGVYALVEAVDDVFTQLRYSSDINFGEGGIYKEVKLTMSVLI